MSKTLKTFSAILAVVVVLVLGWFVVLGVALTPECENTIVRSVENDSRKFVAILFERSCGATTGYSTQVSIVLFGENLRDEVGNVYIANGRPDNSSITWLDSNTLRVNGTTKDAYKRADEIHGVRVYFE